MTDAFEQLRGSTASTNLQTTLGQQIATMDGELRSLEASQQEQVQLFA